MGKRKLYYTDYVRIAKENPPLPIYYIFGNDLYQKDQILKILLKRFVSEEAKEFDFSSFFGDEVEANTIVDQLEMMPFLATYRVVLLRNYNALNPTDKKAILKYVQNPYESSIFIIMNDAFDGRTGFAKAVKKNGIAIECKAPYNEKDIQRWLSAYGRTMKVRFTQDAAAFFSQVVELDYQTAANEVEKLILYTNGKKNIDLDAVKSCVGMSKTHTIFELQNAIGNKKTAKALDCFENMLEHQESLIFIIVMLNRFFLILWKINAYRKQHLTDYEISKLHLKEVFPMFRNDYLGFAKNYKLEDLNNIFDELLKADIKMKTSSIDEKIIGEILIFSILNKNKL